MACLPEDVINYILEYGDVDVTRKFSHVLSQMTYLKNEFTYLRTFGKNFYYRWPPSLFFVFIIIRNRQKMLMNIRNIKKKIIFDTTTRKIMRQRSFLNIQMNIMQLQYDRFLMLRIPRRVI